jgi:hypothetical protein
VRELRLFDIPDLVVTATVLDAATGEISATVTLQESEDVPGYYTGDFSIVGANVYDVRYTDADGELLGAETIRSQSVSSGGDATEANQEEILTQLGALQDSVDGLSAASGGDGDIAVNHNTGGADNLRVTRNGTGVDECRIRAYLKSEYDAGLRNVKGESLTGNDGRWLSDMMLNAGVYILTFDAPDFQVFTKEVTVAS